MIEPSQANKKPGGAGSGKPNGSIEILKRLWRCRPGTSTRPRGFAARQDFAAGEWKAASRSRLLPKRRADAHQSYDPLLDKTRGGEQRAYVTFVSDAMFRPCMPVGERAVLRVTWNHFYRAVPPSRNTRQ